MTSAITIQASSTAFQRQTTVNVAGNLTPTSTPTKSLCLQPRRFTVISFQASENEASISSPLTSSIRSPSLHLPLPQPHLTVFNVATCAVAISATCLFCSAIPTLLAFKRAAESLEKLLDVTREELPGTMIAVRLSGMEISDLTTELSDLGQELTQGVKNSTNAVRMTEERLCRFANLTSRAPMQEVISTKAATAESAVARTARNIREGIVKGRVMLTMMFGLTRSLTSLINYFSKRSKKQALNK